ncbi:hypothetical protein [Frigoriflavimonas asaccharolytica]|uniref:Uncharacterized protein n=1 Tax=Frigoriflavimonas asaccharolytica TaxID=2735899 RepID=A0A8J8GAJ7_9FLAO|nr:hypothetical protein [Frigoriflavimonas asaccharolytica]NRS92654.1 hypothetical protein [Frigoriflavimonas asaccharolytica]
MKKSILRLMLFSVLPLLVICFAVYITGKKTDDFYKRFTSPQQNSLILGSSRAAGMNPAILDSITKSKFPKVKLYNYAFTWAHSPFGPKYLESIEKKIQPNSKDGLFIVTVEPTALMVDRSQADRPENFVENDKSVARTSMVAINPNVEYLWESFEFSITKELNNKIIPPKDPIGKMEILDNGKIQTTIIRQVSDKTRAEWNDNAMKLLKIKMAGLKTSKIRLQYLAKTIDFLKKHGKVVVLRIPMAKVPYDIENDTYPDFDAQMNKICSQKKVSYKNYNLSENNFKYVDEVHLDTKSMNQFCEILAKDIISN